MQLEKPNNKSKAEMESACGIDDAIALLAGENVFV